MLIRNDIPHLVHDCRLAAIVSSPLPTNNKFTFKAKLLTRNYGSVLTMPVQYTYTTAMSKVKRLKHTEASLKCPWDAWSATCAGRVSHKLFGIGTFLSDARITPIETLTVKNKLLLVLILTPPHPPVGGPVEICTGSTLFQLYLLYLLLFISYSLIHMRS